MLSKSLQLNSLSIVRYGSSFVLGLVLCTASAPVLAHVGHNSEFAGGDATKIMQPIEVDASKATALGIKTEAIAPTTDGGILKIPSTSLIDANGQAKARLHPRGNDIQTHLGSGWYRLWRCGGN